MLWGPLRHTARLLLVLRYPSDSDHSERPSLNPFSEAAATLLAFVIFSVTLLVAHAHLFIHSTDTIERLSCCRRCSRCWWPAGREPGPCPRGAYILGLQGCGGGWLKQMNRSPHRMSQIMIMQRRVKADKDTGSVRVSGCGVVGRFVQVGREGLTDTVNI